MSSLSAYPSTYVKINDTLGISGALESSNMDLLNQYKSCLYLNPDTPNDLGCEGGFQTIVNKMSSSNALNIPIDVSAAPFSNGDMIRGFALYKEIEAAIDKLEKPILLICKSNRRAGAVFSLYSSIKEKKNKEQLLATVTELNLSYLSVPSLQNWVLKTHQISTSSILRRQFFESQSSTYSYLIVCSDTKESIIIDPVIETVERDAQIIRDMGIKLKYCLNTHVHADHITGSGKLKALFPTCLSIISNSSGAESDIKVNDGDIVEFGKRYITCLSTPGHTEGCMSFVLDDLTSVYTGDALLVRGCGRTDFQGGSASRLYDAVHTKLFTLPDDCIVYPAHDYKGHTQSTVGEEMKYNPRLTKSKEEFINIMNNLNLAKPAKIDSAVQANLKCGIF